MDNKFLSQFEGQSVAIRSTEPVAFTIVGALRRSSVPDSNMWTVTLSTQSERYGCAVFEASDVELDDREHRSRIALGLRFIDGRRASSDWPNVIECRKIVGTNEWGAINLNNGLPLIKASHQGVEYKLRQRGYIQNAYNPALWFKETGK